MEIAGGKLSVTCSACHRGLSDPVSVELGIGPVCRKRQGVAEPAEKGSCYRDHATRSTWTFVVEGAFVVVTDLDQGMSVTNDAEAVVEQLAKKVPLAGRRILYRDTSGSWDELRHQGGRFAGFAPVGTRGTYLDAIAAAGRGTP